MGMLHRWTDSGSLRHGNIPTMGELRREYLQDVGGATAFDFEPDIACRSSWDESDLRLVVEVMARTRAICGLGPDMGDYDLAESLGRHAIFGPSRLSRSERFARATFHFHELCARIFGDHPQRETEPDTPSPEWREAFRAYVFFLRVADVSHSLDLGTRTPEERLRMAADEYGKSRSREPESTIFAHAAE